MLKRILAGLAIAGLMSGVAMAQNAEALDHDQRKLNADEHQLRVAENYGDARDVEAARRRLAYDRADTRHDERWYRYNHDR